MIKTFYILISIIIMSSIFISTVESREYTSSKYSKYCYFKGEENKNIKTKVYYKTLEECKKPLKI